MGWNGGTDLFDKAVEVALSVAPQIPAHLTEHPSAVPDEIIQTIVDLLYPTWQDSDWDTEDESKYFKPYLLNTMLRLEQIDQEDYDDYMNGIYY